MTSVPCTQHYNAAARKKFRLIMDEAAAAIDAEPLNARKVLNRLYFALERIDDRLLGLEEHALGMRDPPAEDEEVERQ